jgi:protein O-GlcNAc transferase
MHPSDTAHELFRRGNQLYGAGDRSAAANCYQRALQIDPALSEASFNLGCTLDALSGPAQALPYYQQAATLRPAWWQARASLGLALARVGRMAEAAEELAAALRLNPDDPGLRNNLGLALSALGRGEEAHAAFQEAIRLDPGYPEAHSNLAILFERFGRSSEAIACCRQALALRPEYPEAHLNLANTLKSQGRHQEALAHYREALRLKPDFVEAHSSLLFALCYPAEVSREQLSAEHARFGAACRVATQAHDNAPDPDRVLRIGYLSADFRDHAVARFIEPVLRHHDPTRCAITCYSNVAVPDATSDRLAGLAGRLVQLAGVPDEEAAERLRGDRIDILVELSGHSAGNRLLLMARKPAPVQVTWLGYPETTGLDAIDYRITDTVCDPPGSSEEFHSEKLLRLPGTFSCFAPPEEAPPVAELPARFRGYLTFGSFNNPAKITPETVALWAGVLRGVPESRMLIKGYSLTDAGSRERLLGLFAGQGIAPARLELKGNTVSYREHLQLYAGVDIALDSFPYNGTTTTCEALWMGVPVVTLAGEAHRSRVGATLLNALGLAQCIARHPQDFVERALRLGADLEGLARLRHTLRGSLAASPLTDGARFTRELEAAYRDIWQVWCTAQDPHAAEISRPAGHRNFGPSSPDSLKEAAQATDSAPLAVQLGARKLQEGELDAALASFVVALSRDAECGEALGGIEAVLSRQQCADLFSACHAEARRLGLAPATGPSPGVREETLAEAAQQLLCRGLVTPAELACRYLEDRGYRSSQVSSTLAEVALALDLSAQAAQQLRHAVELGAGRQAAIRLLKAEESSRCPRPPTGERFLLIKAWGYGFWSDVNHVLGQCLVAEITGRIPVVHWGGNSLFSDDPAANAFVQFFEPVSGYRQRDLASRCQSFYPPKWDASNLTLYGINQAAGPWSRCSSLYALARGEDLVVSDFHHSVHDLVPWIPPGHPLHGLDTDQVYQYLYRRYLKVQPAISSKVEAYYRQHLAEGRHLALHIRGGDKGGEDPNLALLNSLYPAEIERHLKQYPEAGIFLITDDSSILEEYRQRYGKRILTTCATRTSTGRGVHYQKQSSRFRLGEEVLIDVLLASRCERFVGNGLSNVSCAVAQLRAWPEGSCRLLGARLDRLRQLTLYRS